MSKDDYIERRHDSDGVLRGLTKGQARFLTISTAFTTGLLAIVLIFSLYAAFTGRAVTHGSIYTQLNRIENQVAYISCLLEVGPELRTEFEIAACQVFLEQPNDPSE